MKRAILATCMGAAFAVGLSAQTTPPQTTPPQTPPQTTSPTQPPAGQSMSRDAAKSVTVTGCLKAGETPEAFMLSDLKWDSKGSTGAVGTSGTGAPATAPIAASSIKLTGSPSGTKLSEHVGHTVEVTGMLSDSKGSAAGSTTTEPAAPAKSSAAMGPALDVRSVKMVSSTCTAK